MASLGTKKETVSTTKPEAADRLGILWTVMAKRVRGLGLANLKVESLADKDFKPMGEEMTKAKKNAEWIWAFDYDAFDFEFNLVVGSRKMLLASAKMNMIGDMARRREILDAMRGPTSIVTQADIDKYMKELEARASKNADIKKIDDEVKSLTLDIKSSKEFIAGLAKSVEKLDRGQRQMDLEPIAAKHKLAGYVRFVYGLDAGFAAYKLMKDHFVKGAPYPLTAFPPAMTASLVKQFGADEKGEPDFAPARKIAVPVIDAKAMPAYRKEMTDQSTKSMHLAAARIKLLLEKRKKSLGF